MAKAVPLSVVTPQPGITNLKTLATTSVMTASVPCWPKFLNHPFMSVEGDATEAEYGGQGTVRREITAIISAWIKKG